MSSSFGDILVDFEDRTFPVGQDHQYAAPLSGISIVNAGPFGAFGADYAVSSRKVPSSATFSTAYWSNGDSSVVSTGGAGGSSKWLSVFNFAPKDIVLTAADNHIIKSLQFNNNSIVAYTAANGLGGFSNPLNTPGSFFRVRFVGFNSAFQQLGTTDWTDLVSNVGGFNVLSTWQNVDLSPLNSQRIGLEFDGSDQNGAGLLTPTYLAIDNIIMSSITAVPEPGSLGMLAVAAIGCLLRRPRIGRSR